MEFTLPFQKPCQVETRRLLLVIGIITSAAFGVEFFFSPYENVFLSLFPANNVPVHNETSYYHTGNSSPKSVMIGSSPPLYPSTMANLTLVNGVVNNTEASGIGEQTNNGPNGDDGEKTDYMSPLLTLPPVGSPSSLSIPKELDANFSTSEIGKQTNNETNGDDGEETDYLSPMLTLPPVGSPISPTIPKELDANFNTSETSEMGKQTTKEANGEKIDYVSRQLTLPPVGSTISLNIPKELDANFSTSVVSVNSNKSSVDKQASGMLSTEEKPGLLQTAPATPKSIMTGNYVNKARNLRPPKSITSISKMNLLLLKSRASSHSMRLKWSSEPDQEILAAKSQIENAPIIKNDRELYAPLFRNLSTFKRSYELMEDTLKVYVYKEGAKPIFHEPILEGIYASEGWFMKQMEANKQFVVKDPRKAHLFYLPFSSQSLRYTLYVPNSHSKKNLIKYLKDYMDMIMAKYPFWNRTGGADHFLAACHDWAPSITKRLMSQCIRALCNSDVIDGFKIGKDISLPETFVHFKNNPLQELGGKPPSERRTLAFFAGNMHGYLRPILLKYWENKDPDMKIYGKMNKTLKKEMNYIQHMKRSKYCICAKGYEVNSPRVVEAIFFECVPVIISDNYVPPFFEVLDWEAFAVFVPEKDIPNLKTILLSIPKEKYIEMHKRVKKVQQHFLWHTKPVKYDIFHMTLHSIWYNRVFQFEPK
ncbi:Exostosin-like [Macleaya cordata]|uniref:Exostosin-like n=1 Tax=Macleaya cordata TaxID=56857 RepID=A0A200QDL7_MACCD|nr:Exostosin-like [Macleaya cordata]